MNTDQKLEEGSQLFTIDNKPLQFYLAELNNFEFYKYFKLIEENGGEGVESPDENTINLVKTNSNLKINNPYDYYDIKYIEDCINASDLQLLQPYRILQRTNTDIISELKNQDEQEKSTTDLGESLEQENSFEKSTENKTEVNFEMIAWEIPPVIKEKTKKDIIILISSDEECTMDEPSKISNKLPEPSKKKKQILSKTKVESTTSRVRSDNIPDFIDLEIESNTSPSESKNSSNTLPSKSKNLCNTLPSKSKNFVQSSITSFPARTKVTLNIDRKLPTKEPRKLFGRVVREIPLPSSSSDEEADLKIEIDELSRNDRFHVRKKHSSISKTSRPENSSSDTSDCSLDKSNTRKIRSKRNSSKVRIVDSTVVHNGDGKKKKNKSNDDSQDSERNSESDVTEISTSSINQIEKPDDIRDRLEGVLPETISRKRRRCWLQGDKLVFETDFRPNKFNPKFDYRDTLWKKNFQLWELNEMIKYLYNSNNFHRSTSTNVWKEMLEEGFLPHRTPSSLLHRFAQHIKPNLEEFIPDEDLRNRILAMMKEKKKKK